METTDAQAYAADWIDAWNAHDLDRVLIHYADDVVFHSPVAARVRPDIGGVVRGKALLADYWGTALPLVPDLHFTLEETFASVDALTILYRNQRGQRVTETLVFNDVGLVVFGLGAYAPES
jgi:ketosteroid isomerase-like protein